MNNVDFVVKAASVDNFMDIYPDLNERILAKGDSVSSRNGPVKEQLNWKVELHNPIKRCVGGYDRDVNIFFLLAEALWIWGGRKDVQFLKFFNSNMAGFSDDGVNFHAPYGFRLRHYGKSSIEPIGGEEQMHSVYLSKYGIDQIATVIDLLHTQPDTRRAVMSIWNPTLDLTNSKDIPCNDLVMLQISDNKLHMTIANRSNDLHWGLPTNVFQFSWILELMSISLGVEVGTQTHNSKSLHLYTENEIPRRMNNSLNNYRIYNLVNESKMDIHIESSKPLERIEILDDIIDEMLGSLEECMYSDIETNVHPKSLGDSKYMITVFQILEVFVNYKKRQISDNSRSKLLSDLILIEENCGMYCRDYLLLAKNWALNRIVDHKIKMSLIQEHNLGSEIGSL